MYFNKEMKNKVSQTSFSLDKVSKSIQTKVLNPHNKIIHPSSINICTPHTQKIECIQYKSCTKNSDSVSSKNTNSDNSKSTFSPEELVFSKINSPVDLGKGSDVKNVKHGTNGKKYSDLESKYHIDDKNTTGERNLLQESEKNCENKKTKVIKPQNEVIYPSSIKICTPQTQKIECIRYKNYTKNSDSFSSKRKTNNDNSKSTSSEELVFVKVVKNPAEYSNEKIVQNRCTEKKYSDLESKYRTENDDKVEEKNSMLHDNKEYYPQKLKKNGDIESDKEKERVSQSERSNASMSNSGNTTESSVLKNDRKYRSGLGKYSDSDKESGSKELLAEMISLNQSRDLNTDVKRSINILQKLLKSKKYDQSTKKYYIKKIVEKIVESRYSDDSTTSSELFRPKKNSVATLSIPEKLTENKIEMVQKESSLMDNIPWYPVAPPTIISPKKLRKLTTKLRELKFRQTEKFLKKNSKLFSEMIRN
ncbi:hypothetical protein HHI36_007286 [Cryptolaemus montrouzieri]|uniref:Uncharacterized protein n=1 Tax=Cryptolaemus montrouzieri TaxID=559131 RepID=A0ABD2MPK6_9CUCU